MKVSRVFFDVGFERNEILVDERRGLLIAVRLSFQPSACTSSRRRTEINEHGFLI
jgi:hypothetical protein